MSGISQEKSTLLLEKHFIDCSRTAYQRDIITFSDFLNLNEQNILNTLPKDKLFTQVLSFGGYQMAERQMAAFIPEALYLYYGKDILSPENLNYPFSALRISPANRRFSEELSHRDYLGAILNLGIDRSKTGDILIKDYDALVFVHNDMIELIINELKRIKHTSVIVCKAEGDHIDFSPRYEEIKGTVASVRLDSLLAIAFSSSRTSLTGYIEGGRVFVNGKLITSNGYQVNEGDIISVRGMGKFRYEGAGQRTRKNRISVKIYKYI